MAHILLSILNVVGALGIFLFGMKMMSESLQKVTGDKMRSILTVMTRNRFMGVFTGVLITALIQSSTATTLMVVSFVNAGLLSLVQSISVIMGANIGTTVTAWLISLVGFQINIAELAIPLIALSLPFIFSAVNRRRYIGELIMGFAFLFLGLEYLKGSMPDLNRNPEILAFLSRYSDMGFLSVLLYLLIGTLFTIILQSSAATITITLVMCSQGWIPFELAAAMVLGENIGTTLTTNLAALSANTSAKRAAFSHLIFNLFGVFWMLIVFYPFTRAIAYLVAHYGPGDPTALTSFALSLDPDTLHAISDSSGRNLTPELAALRAQLHAYQAATSYSLSLFHTCFNLINTCIMIWFVGLIARVVSFVIPRSNSDEEFSLTYISTGMLSTSELSILQARKEITVFVERTRKMFGLVRSLNDEKAEPEVIRLYSRIEKYEAICDRLELEIAGYLNRVAEGRLSDTGKAQVHNLLRLVSEVESIGDSCFNLGRTLLRQHEKKILFPDEIRANLLMMLDLLDEALSQMALVLSTPEPATAEKNRSYNIEHEINNLRNQLKTQNIINVNERHYDYETGTLYMDFIIECEKMGDYIINVIEAHR